ncbi:MAG TPA: peptidase MA family metallohydrolase [Verrucomicrobiae bacterium]|jgi:hypothetical protein|nr:peptidase MA family metallohydrolase [Verrucomicrobiae bacterium]
MKALPFFLAALFACPAAWAQAPWQEIKSDHFIVYSATGERTFMDQVAAKSELYYDAIANWLGYARRDGFWTWDGRCKIYVYGSREHYLGETGQAAWSNGAAVLERRMILSFQEAPGFLDSVLPHELAHLIFRDFVGGKGRIPLWLDEGVAMAQEKDKRKEFDVWIAKMIAEKKWIPMETFMKVGNLQETPGDEAVMFYAQAQSVVRFLLEGYGSERFAGFCRSLRDGDTPQDALAKNYPQDFPTLQAFEGKWAASAVPAAA